MNIRTSTPLGAVRFSPAQVISFAAHRKVKPAVDPSFAAVARYREAMRNFVKAKRGCDDLDKKLPPDVTRGPRVQYGFLTRLENQSIKEPIYRTNTYEIDQAIEDYKRIAFSLRARGQSRAARKARTSIREQLRKKRSELLAGLAHDAEEQQRKQRVCGYLAAKEAYIAALNELEATRRVVCRLTPKTTDGVAAVLQFIADTSAQADATGIDALTFSEQQVAILLTRCARALKPTEIRGKSGTRKGEIKPLKKAG